MADQAGTSSKSATKEERIKRLLVGAVDSHCHSGPSVMPRDFNHVEAMMEAVEVGMKAMLIKDHYYSATPITELLKQTHKHVPIRLLSGVPMNNATGGFNKHAVDHGIKLGADMVWMPTFASKNHCDHHKAPWDSKGLLPPDPLTPLDANGKLKPEVLPILDLIAEANIVLSGGHLHISEIYVVFEEALKRGVKKLLVNHPTFLIGCTPEDITRLVDMGAYIEHSFCMFIPSIKKGKPGRFTAEDLDVLIKAASVDRTILASDLGQVGNDRPVPAFRTLIGQCIDLGYSDEDIRKMISTNACDLFGIK
jgi:hypothetical protein